MQRYLQYGQLSDQIYDQDLEDFLRLTAGQGADQLSKGRQFSQAALDAFNFVNTERELGELNQKYGGEQAAEFLISGDDISNEARAAVQIVDQENQATSVVGGSYKRLKDSLKTGAMKDVFEDKLIRRSTFAIAGLAAFGFIYSAAKDKSYEDMSGPPLLPGGSAYEDDYPKQLPSLSDLKYLNPTVAGMQYKINVSGSEEQIQKMQYLANTVVGGQVDSTIYDGLPRLGRDPYQNIAGSF